MGKLDKLIAELLRADPPREMAYRDISKVLLAFGWTEREAAGSHIRWEKSGHVDITATVHGGRRVSRVGPGTIKDVREAITDKRCYSKSDE